MTLWSPEVTTAALNYTGKDLVIVAVEKFEAAPARWVQIARNRLQVEARKALGVDLDLQDIQVTPSREDTADGTVAMLHARWVPESRQVEYRGGPLHKKLGVSPNDQPVTVYVSPVPSTLVFDQDAEQPKPSQAPVPVTSLTYRRSMWMSEARTWVYQPG